MPEALQDLAGVAGELAEVRAAEGVLDLRLRLAARDLRRLRDVDAEVLGLARDDLLAHPVHDRELVVLAPSRVDEVHEDVRQVAGHAGVVADRDERVVDARQRADLAGDALGQEARLGEARPLRGAHVDVELGDVVRRA